MAVFILLGVPIVTIIAMVIGKRKDYDEIFLKNVFTVKLYDNVRDIACLCDDLKLVCGLTDAQLLNVDVWQQTKL